MAVLDDVLKEEYDRLERMKSRMKEEYDALPNGYLSKKNIRGYESYYFQHREGDKVVGFYVREDEVPVYSAQVEKRRGLKKTLKEIDEQIKKIEKVIK